MTEDVGDAGARGVGVGLQQTRRGAGRPARAGVWGEARGPPRSAAQDQGSRGPRTVDSRTWLWKCCSRADTSSCPSILLHARRRAVRVLALRRTIARGRRGCTAARCRTGTPPRPQRARKTPPRPPPRLRKKRLPLREAENGRRRAGLAAGAGPVRHSEGAARQRRAPRRRVRGAEGR